MLLLSAISDHIYFGILLFRLNNIEARYNGFSRHQFDKQQRDLSNTFIGRRAIAYCPRIFRKEIGRLSRNSSIQISLMQMGELGCAVHLAEAGYMQRSDLEYTSEILRCLEEHPKHAAALQTLLTCIEANARRVYGTREKKIQDRYDWRYFDACKKSHILFTVSYAANLIKLAGGSSIVGNWIAKHSFKQGVTDKQAIESCLCLAAYPGSEADYALLEWLENFKSNSPISPLYLICANRFYSTEGNEYTLRFCALSKKLVLASNINDEDLSFVIHILSGLRKAESEFIAIGAILQSKWRTYSNLPEAVKEYLRIESTLKSIATPPPGREVAVSGSNNNASFNALSRPNYQRGSGQQAENALSQLRYLLEQQGILILLALGPERMRQVLQLGPFCHFYSQDASSSDTDAWESGWFEVSGKSEVDIAIKGLIASMPESFTKIASSLQGGIDPVVDDSWLSLLFCDRSGSE